MPKYLNQIKALKKINKSTIINSKFLINAEKNIKIYYAPFDYINPKAKIMIVGLAPAAHGGTRTGRAFTGDKSGDFLFKCLKAAKISNKAESINIDDGLKIQRTYITNILKCVPPGDKPLNIELNNCANYFDNEISILKDLKVIVTLGKVAFDNCIKFYKRNYSFNKKIIFKHGVKFDLPDGKILIPSYHPSPRNVNTKIINLKMMTNLFINVKKII